LPSGWRRRCGKNADGTWTYQHIEEAVSAGLLSEQRVNESCARVLSQKFAAGLFEDPAAGVADNATLARLLDAPPHRRLALEAAEQGCVLLRNTNDTLPLTPTSCAARSNL
jgi:beta-glucosidase